MTNIQLSLPCTHEPSGFSSMGIAHLILPPKPPVEKLSPSCDMPEQSGHDQCTGKGFMVTEWNLRFLHIQRPQTMTCTCVCHVMKGEGYDIATNAPGN